VIGNTYWHSAKKKNLVTSKGDPASDLYKSVLIQNLSLFYAIRRLHVTHVTSRHMVCRAAQENRVRTNGVSTLTGTTK